MGFNENLKLLLLEKSMKQADLCRMTGIQTSLMDVIKALKQHLQ